MRFILIAAASCAALSLVGCVQPSWRHKTEGPDQGTGIVLEPLATEGEVDAVKDAGIKEAAALRAEIANAEKRATEFAANGDNAVRGDLEKMQTEGAAAFRQAIEEGKTADEAKLEELRKQVEIGKQGVEEAKIRAAEAVTRATAAQKSADDEGRARVEALNKVLADFRADKIGPKELQTALAEFKKGLPTGDNTALWVGLATAALGTAGGVVAHGSGKKKGQKEGEATVKALTGAKTAAPASPS